MKICGACDTRFEDPGFQCPQCGHAPPAWPVPVPGQLDGIPCFAPERAFANDGFDPEFFPVLAEAQDRHFWLRQRTALVLWALDKYFPGAQRVLELGCGGGGMLRAIHAHRPGITLDGADLFVSGLALAAQALPEGSRLMQMDAAALPFEAEYDIVSLFDVLEHTDDDGAVLASSARALIPGGGLLLTVPQHRFLWSHLDEMAHHRRRYASRRLKAKLKAAGFRVEAAISYQSLLLPAMYLARFAYHRSRHPSDVLRINRILNGIFDGICAVERAMIRSRVRLPFGDSLLIVARREHTGNAHRVKRHGKPVTERNPSPSYRGLREGHEASAGKTLPLRWGRVREWIQ